MNLPLKHQTWPESIPAATSLKRAILGAVAVLALGACGGGGGPSEGAASTPLVPDSTNQSTIPTVVQTTVPLAKWGPESWKLVRKVDDAVDEFETTIKAAKSRAELLIAIERSRLKFEDLAEELAASDLAHAKDIAQLFLPEFVAALDDLIAAATSNDEDATTVALAKVDYLTNKWSDIRKCTFNKTRDCV